MATKSRSAASRPRTAPPQPGVDVPARAKAPRSRPLPLPHERDESADVKAAKPRAAIRTAQGDVAAGAVDTDNYTRSRDVMEHRSPLPKPGDKR